ncbi:MAG: ABC transporter permease [Saprospiraceae bacterium]|nr:ABC transporter permease [Saprospiraceae bacterium]
MRWLRGDFGTSNRDNRAIAEKLSRPLSITLIMSTLAMILAYSSGIFLAFYGTLHREKRRSRWLTTGLFGLYALPTFWIATLAVVFLTTPTYGLKFFPSIGLADTASKSIDFEWFTANFARLILPILCMMLHPMTVIARQLSGSMREVLPLDFIRTARAKGLSTPVILRGHVFQNAVFPLITLLGAMLPSVIAGSFIVELIFNIPGMGRAAFDAFLNAILR